MEEVETSIIIEGNIVRKSIVNNELAIDASIVLVELLYAYSKEWHSQDQIMLMLYSMKAGMIKRGHKEEDAQSVIDKILLALASNRSKTIQDFMG